MDGREPYFFVVVLGFVALGLDVREQRELREKFLDRAELKRERGELFEVVEARAVVRESFLEIIVVAASITSRSIFDALLRTISSSSCAIVAVNCAHASVAFFGTRAMESCNATASGVLDFRSPLTPSLSPSDGERVAEGRVRGNISRLKFCHNFSAAFAPTPGSNCASRLKAISSRGFAMNFRNAVASLMCACSKKRMPLVMENGICRFVSS